MADTEQTTTQPPNGQSAWEDRTVPSADGTSSRPELYVGAALLGGIVLAQVLKRLGGDD